MPEDSIKMALGTDSWGRHRYDSRERDVGIAVLKPPPKVPFPLPPPDPGSDGSAPASVPDTAAKMHKPIFAKDEWICFGEGVPADDLHTIPVDYEIKSPLPPTRLMMVRDLL